MVPSDDTHVIELVPLSATTMAALVEGDLERARHESGAQLTAYFLDEAWLWRIRLEQAAKDPAALAWVARAARDGRTGEVVGHVGFHGPPDYRGMVEVAYAVDPAYRRRGYARAMLRTALAWAAAEPSVEVVRASISPANHASMATLRPFGFRHVGEQYDEEDGLELLFERPAGPADQP
jgi:RimJ/RimL family protein N-acetyltransferase